MIVGYAVQAIFGAFGAVLAAVLYYQTACCQGRRRPRQDRECFRLNRRNPTD